MGFRIRKAPALLPIAIVLLLVAAAVGLLAAVGLVLLRGVPSREAAVEEYRSVRVEATMRDGIEQTLLALVRTLELPVGGTEVGYGDLYLESQDTNRLLVRSRSQLDRGFIGTIDLASRPGRTHVRYALIRLPADEEVRDRVRRFEATLIGVLQRLGAGDTLQATPAAARDLHRADTTGSLDELLLPNPDPDPDPEQQPQGEE